ncbi:DUF484 family protein [Marinicauda algicola]|uniref:DUF484 family protein n=1 Tax=Marinicauda algicola TaxID=2029849 RepID=A0A4S2H0C9_9PROT|nr:DUF484 family protein [Marinicauda algicola]TGY88833.1 DUF484 family protein [Marinicauda algicola]
MSDTDASKPRLFAVPGSGLPDTGELRADSVVDINAAARAKLQGEIRRLKATNEALIALAKANLAVQAQTHSAVLAILEADTLAAFDRKLAGRVAGALNVDLVKVFIEGHAPLRTAESVLGAAPELVKSLLGEAPARLGPVDRRFADALYGAQAHRQQAEALVRLDIAGRAGVMCLAARDREAFTPEQGTDLLHFLARVVERRLALFLRDG